MANTIKVLNRFLNDINNRVLGTTFLKSIGEQAKSVIFKRVKAGFGVNSDTIDNPQLRKFPSLSPAYVKQRQKKGVSGKFGSPRFSNLTFTGQLLDSMKVKASPGTVIVEIPNNRRRDGKLTNAGLAELVRKQNTRSKRPTARPFFALAKNEVKILEKALRDEVRRSFNRNF